MYEYFSPGLGPGESCKVNTQWIPLPDFLGRTCGHMCLSPPGPLHLAFSQPALPATPSAEPDWRAFAAAWCSVLGGCRVR